MPTQSKTGDFTEFALEYDRYRIGYSPELYEVIKRFGLQRGGKVLDVACGTGLSAAAFASQGFEVTGIDSTPAMLEHARVRVPSATFAEAAADQLPFADGSFDAVTCAQAFHWFNTPAAMSEFMRVTRSGGLVAIWWKHLLKDDPVRLERADVYRAMGKPELVTESLQGGFSTFYGAPFADRHLRALRFPHHTSVESYLGYERSRKNAHAHFGDQVELYFTRLEAALVAKFGSRDAQLWLTYVIYLYAGIVR